MLCAALLASATPAAATTTPPRSRVQAVSFLNANEGWIAGWHSSELQGGFVSYTSDGGQSWAATRTAVSAGLPMSGIVALPSASAIGTADIYSASAWLFSNGGWNRSQGGTIIQRAVPAKTIRLSGGRLVSVGAAQDWRESGTEGSHGRVAYVSTSDDDGLTWTKRYVGPLYWAADGSAASTWASFSDIDASPDGSVLWAVGNEWTSSGTSPGAYKNRLIFRSTNGGVTWTPQTPPTGTLALNAVIAASNTVAYAFGNAKVGIKTTNGGASWANTTMPTFLSTGVGTLPHIAAADSLDANTVVIVANRQRTRLTDPYTAQIARTTNGGSTWSLSGLYDTNLYDVQMVTPTFWTAVGSHEHIIRSTDAGVSWSYPSGESAPNVARQQPTANFSYMGAVPISGTANDGTGVSAGVGVRSVEVRIRRSNGSCWNGVGWTSPGVEAWVPATTANGWKNWSYTFVDNGTLVVEPSIVNVVARATDGIGLQRSSTSVNSKIEIAAGITIDDGETYSSTTTVPVSVATSSPATNMRWWVDSGAKSAWVAFEQTSTVPMGAGEGTRTVSFDFAVNNDTSTVAATASDDIVVDTVVPDVAITEPSAGFSVQYPNAVIARATVADERSGVASVDYAIERADGLFWDNAGWIDAPYWMSAESEGGSVWKATWKPQDDSVEMSQDVTFRFRATDNAGNAGYDSVTSAVREPFPTNFVITSGSTTLSKYGASYTFRGRLESSGTPVAGQRVRLQSSAGPTGFTNTSRIATTAADGSFSFSFITRDKRYYRAVFVAGETYYLDTVSSYRRVTPRAWVGTPVAPKTMYRGRYAKVYGSLKPRHTSGTYPVRLLIERKVGTTWKRHTVLKAKASNYYSYSRYTRSVRFKTAGRYRIRAIHPDDALHARAVSAKWRYVTVR